MFARIRRPMQALTAALATSTAAAGVIPMDAAGLGQEPDIWLRFESALDRYERGHYEAAFDEFAALADDGHCQASRIAHQMARLGRTLYPVAFRIEAGRLQRWQRREGCPSTQAAWP